MASLCIVDSSVFIDFFKGKDVPEFEGLLARNQVVLSDFVRLELLMGVRKAEEPKLAHVLDGLIHLTHDPEIFQVAEKILRRIKSLGLTVGTIDVALAAQAHLSGFPIMSHDKVFAKIAKTRLIRVWPA